MATSKEPLNTEKQSVIQSVIAAEQKHIQASLPLSEAKNKRQLCTVFNLVVSLVCLGGSEVYLYCVKP